MKNKIIFLCLISLLNTKNFSQLLTLPHNWQFKTGDNLEYMQSDFNDSEWDSIYVPANWENQGYENYNGFGWYRVHFNININSIKSTELMLLLGKIDDADETYLNDKLLGKTGSVAPNYSTAWNLQRAYEIPHGLLKNENTLAVRVYDEVGGGGIYGGEFGICDKETYIDLLNLKPAPKKSFNQIVTSNGLISAVYNELSNSVEYVKPYIFRDFDSTHSVKPFVYNIKLNANIKPGKIEYFDNTHVICADYEKYKVYYFAPFTTSDKIFYAAIAGKNEDVKNLKFTYEKSYCNILSEEKIISFPNNEIVKYFLFSFNDSLQSNTQDFQKALSILDSINMLDNEILFMKNVFAKSHYPQNISADEKNLYEQSITVLKMGQVADNEIFPKSRGQIIASLLPGNWNIGWVRDAVYSIMALNKLNLFDEAKSAINFFLNADAGYYKNFILKEDGIDYGVKSDYQISVCRYFGPGVEEADGGDNPNIELDGFGLFLIGFSDYINQSNDIEFLKANYEKINKLIADPILTFIDSNKIIRTESGPWEYHLPGKQYAFTANVNSVGLRNYSELLKHNSLNNYEKYFSAHKELTEGIKNNFIYEGKTIKGFKAAENPNTKDFYDGGTIEIFNFNIITDQKFYESYYNDYENNLRISERRGFSRLNNPDWYTISEWPFLNMRIISTLLKFKKYEKAKQLFDWTTNYSKLNHNLIAELYDHDTENYGGEIPMVGYGAGAYILTLNDMAAYLYSFKK